MLLSRSSARLESSGSSEPGMSLKPLALVDFHAVGESCLLDTERIHHTGPASVIHLLRAQCDNVQTSLSSLLKVATQQRNSEPNCRINFMIIKNAQELFGYLMSETNSPGSRLPVRYQDGSGRGRNKSEGREGD